MGTVVVDRASSEVSGLRLENCDVSSPLVTASVVSGRAGAGAGAAPVRPPTSLASFMFQLEDRQPDMIELQSQVGDLQKTLTNLRGTIGDMNEAQTAILEQLNTFREDVMRALAGLIPRAAGQSPH